MQHKIMLVFLPLALAEFCSQAQGTFQNLDFEQAVPVSVIESPFYPYVVTTESALPYWTVTQEGVQQTQIFQNSPSAGAPQVSLISPGDKYNTPIDGSYSVLLQGSGAPSTAVLSQTGTIPSSAQSLLFEAQGNGFGTITVQLGSEPVSFTAVGTGPNYTLYGANISAWAGKTEQLSFFAQETVTGLNNWEIDDISFSPTPVTPEPSPLVLTGIGGLVFALYRRLAPNPR